MSRVKVGPVRRPHRESVPRRTTSPRKSDVTRERILEAARRVFANYQYSAASVRMVAKEGNFPHGIIRYYFPSKAELFRTVLKGICEDIARRNASWLEEVRSMSPAEGLNRYLELFLVYNKGNPEALRVLVQNMALTANPEATPGYEHLTWLLVNTRRTFEEKISLEASTDRVRRFLDSLNGLLLYYLGASPCQAGILGLQPDGSAYRAWVRETLFAVFLPALENLADFGDPRNVPRSRD